MATYELREKVCMTAQFVDPRSTSSSSPASPSCSSNLVRPPRVAESPIHLECRYHGTLTLPANRRHSTHHVVIGEVVGIHIRDDVIGADGKIDIKKIRPLARLGYMDYTSVTEVFTMKAQGNAAGQIGEAVAKQKVAV